jgi:phosphoribosylanthranilate isomerase
MTRIKICGVTLPDDAARVASAGADFIGLNFWPKSKRYVAPERAPMLASVIRSTGTAQIVGVFVDTDPDEVASVLAQVDLDILQLHGNEPPDEVAAIANLARRPLWKAIAAASVGDIERLESWPTDAIMLDAPSPGRGGSGKPFDWAIAREAKKRHPARRFVIAGGLSSDNVGAAVTQLAPWAVDVASGVETAPGIKDPAKVDAFIAAVRAADVVTGVR